MANRIIQNQQVVSSGKKKRKKTKAEKQPEKKRRNSESNPFQWIHSKTFHVIFGLFLIFFALFLFAAFISFFGTHNMDATTASSSLIRTVKNWRISAEIGNSLGILGLYFSFLFIQYGFGIASFGFLFLFLLWGIYFLTGKSILPLFKSFMGAILSIIWVSLLMGGLFGFNSKQDWLGGNIGNTLSQALIGTAIGKMGFALLMILFLIIILTIFFGLTFSHLHQSLEKIEAMKKEMELHKKEEKEKEDDDVKEENTAFAETAPAFPLTSLQTSNPEPSSKTVHVVTTYSQHAEPVTRDKMKDITGKEQATTPMDAAKTGDVAPKDAQEAHCEPFPFATEAGTVTEPDTESELPLTKGTEESEAGTETVTAETAEEYISQLEPIDPRDELIHFQFPDPELLENYTNMVRSQEERETEIRENKDRIRDILSNFGVEIQSISAIEGPTVTMYEIVPAPGVRISKIKNLEDDIALSVAAIGIRIIAPIPGKGTIGIEVPNSVPNIVPMKEMVTSEAFLNAQKKMALPVAIGKTISDETFVFDLAKTPHVLMAGATGQGKSVGLNAVITSLLYSKHPTELKLVLVDPKKVELTLYSKIERHYLAKLPDAADAIITDTKQVVRTLNSLCIEMDNRYDLLKTAQCRNIKEYNEKFISRHLNPEHGHHYLPYIVLIFDEFADCIMTAGREVESPVARLAQLARAVGIHLIVATQRPSVNIITGVIKANFPARIAFRVSSSIDSRTILDNSGAERLIGKGDMLISLGGEVTRIQCALVDTPEIERICDFVGEQHGFTHALLLPEVPEEQEDNSQISDDGEIDPSFADAARIVVQTGHGSTSLLQRKLKLGYNRAGRVMDQLEREGIVGAFEGSKAREVLIHDLNQLEEKLKNMGLA